MTVKNIVKKALERLGFQVMEVAAKPPGAKWAFDVVSPQPLSLRLRVAELETDVLVFGIAIVLSEEHRSAYMRLQTSERMKLTSRIILEVLRVCPYCRVMIQPRLDQLETIVAEVHHYPSHGIDERSVGEYIHRLVNVFLAVNAVLWERFPPREGDEVVGRVFM